MLSTTVVIIRRSTVGTASVWARARPSVRRPPPPTANTPLATAPSLRKCRRSMGHPLCGAWSLHHLQSGGMSWRFITSAALFITCLLTANVLAAKLVVIGGVVLPAGIVIFPVSYIVADVLTEVWGYGAARRVIWLGFACNALMVLAIWIGGELPAAAFWKGQGAYTEILGQTPRIVLASFLASLAGEFANAYVMAKVKILTAGRWLWIRTIGSTIVGEGLDSAVFITLAFAGGLPLA